MAGFQYFFERTTRAQLAPGGVLARSLLASAGLDLVLADVQTVPAGAALVELSAAGPGGKSGSILAPHPVGGEPAVRIGYHRQFQRWDQVGERLWVGHDTEQPPRPADLARRRQFEGYKVELAGAEWKVPVIRNHAGGTGLGCDWKCLGDGQVEERIKDEYRALWEDFAGAVDLFFDPDDPSPAGVFHLSIPEAMRYSLAALGINYRYGPFEQNALGLVDGESWSQILAAAVDLNTFWDVFTAVQQSKKKRAGEAALQDQAQGSAATSPGPAEDCPATPPAAES